jgi:hypothetical protein
MVTAADLRKTRQTYAATIARWAPRAFAVGDADEDGVDAAVAGDAAPGSPAEASVAGIVGFGTFQGSVGGGGWTCTPTIPGAAVSWPDYAGITITVTPSYDGAAEAATALFTGYGRGDAAAAVPAGFNRVQYPLATSHQFLKTWRLEAGIDWAIGGDHTLPVDLDDAVSHILTGHTNLTPRSTVTIDLPAVTYAEALAVSAGSPYAAITSLVGGAFGGEAWAFSRRDDSFVVTTHPNLHPAYAGLASALALDDTHALTRGRAGGWEWSRAPANRYKQAILVGTFPDQTEALAAYPASPGSGVAIARVSGFVVEDQAAFDDLAELYFAHINRRWSGRVSVGMNLAVDLGSIVEVTTSIPQWGETFTAKPFVVTAMSIAANLGAGTLVADLTLDEVVLP